MWWGQPLAGNEKEMYVMGWGTSRWIEYLSTVISSRMWPKGSNEARVTKHSCWCTAVFSGYLGVGQRLPCWCSAPVMCQVAQKLCCGYLVERSACSCATMSNSGNRNIQVWVFLVGWESCRSVRERGSEGNSWWYSGREEVRTFAPRRKTLFVYHRVFTDDTISLKFEQPPPLSFQFLRTMGNKLPTLQLCPCCPVSHSHQQKMFGVFQAGSNCALLLF